jgi:hypothetical protein
MGRVRLTFCGWLPRCKYKVVFWRLVLRLSHGDRPANAGLAWAECSNHFGSREGFACDSCCGVPALRVSSFRVRRKAGTASCLGYSVLDRSAWRTFIEEAGKQPFGGLGSARPKRLSILGLRMA